MKLKKLLKVTDKLADVSIRTIEAIKGAEEEVLYEGSVMEVPWTLVQYKLDTETKTDDAVYIESKRECEGREPRLIIYVVED